MSGEISQSSLALLAVASLAFGLIAALIYDIFRIRRIAINIPILWHFEDFLFMVACGFAFSVIFYEYTSGKVRGFAFASAICGFYIYRQTLGRLIMAASEKIIKFVKYIFRKLLLPPINFVKRVLLSLLGFVKKRICALLSLIGLLLKRREARRQIKDFVSASRSGFVGKNKINSRKNKRKEA